MSFASTTDGLFTLPATTAKAESFSAGSYVYGALLAVVIICGLIGNFCGFVTFQQSGLRGQPCVFLLSLLAVSDSLFLLTGPLRRVCRIFFDLDLRNINDPLCKLHTYLTASLLHMSAWLLTGVAIERVYGVWKGFRQYRLAKENLRLAQDRSRNQSRLFTRVFFVVILLATFAGNIYFFFQFDLDESGKSTSPVTSSGSCQLRNDSSLFLQHFQQNFNLFYGFVAPAVVIFLSNVIIIVLLRKSLRLFQSDGSSRPRQVASRGVSNQNQRQFWLNATTLLLLVTSVCFLLLMLPGAITLFIIYDTNEWLETDRAFSERINLAYLITNGLTCLNSGINFFLYCLAVPKFRAAFFDWTGRLRARLCGAKAAAGEQRSRDGTAGTTESNM